MATFNTYVKLGTRGNSLLSFNLSGCTTNNKNSCTALPDYQDVLHTSFDGTGLYVTGLTLGSTNFIYVEPNRMVSGHTCNLSSLNQMISISGIPTPTPTPSPSPTSTPTPTPTSTPTPTPTSTSTPTPTPTATDIPPTPTSTIPPPTPTSTPVSVWYQLTNCSDSSVAYSEEYPEGQFAIDQKVTTPGGNVWVITNVNTYTNPGGTLYAITSTGFMGCEGVATFSTSLISASRPSGAALTTTETSGTTITVTYNTVTIKLSTWVISGYRSDTSITVNGSSISPDFAGQGATPLSGTGEGNASYTTFILPVGVYNVTDWTVSAISDGSQTIVQAKLEQVT